MIPVYSPFLDDRVRRYVLDCVDSGWIYSLARYVREFETSFARFCGAPYGVETSSGTSALHLELVVLRIGPGDEVLLPSVKVRGHRERDTLYRRAADLRRGRSGHLVHGPCRCPAARHVADAGHHPRSPVRTPSRYGSVSRDGARARRPNRRGCGRGARGLLPWAPGGSARGRGCFSFYGNKIVTTGEGGMVITTDPALAERARFLRDKAMDLKRRYWRPEVGFNYRMTNIQAAIGCAQMERIDEILASKRRIAQQYAEELSEVPGLTLAQCASWAESVFWMYSVLVEDGYGVERDQVMAELRALGIDTRPFFVPIHHLQPYRSAVTLPVSKRLAARSINLPSGLGLTEEEV